MNAQIAHDAAVMLKINERVGRCRLWLAGTLLTFSQLSPKIFTIEISN